jgi:hypothetical protein
VRRWRYVHAGHTRDAGALLGAGRLHAGAPPWTTLHARGVGSPTAGARAVARFARLALTSGL